MDYISQSRCNRQVWEVRATHQLIQPRASAEASTWGDPRHGGVALDTAVRVHNYSNFVLVFFHFNFFAMSQQVDKNAIENSTSPRVRSDRTDGPAESKTL